MGSTAINARQRPLIRIVGLRNIQCPLYWVAATNPMQIITVLLKERIIRGKRRVDIEGERRVERRERADRRNESGE